MVRFVSMLLRPKMDTLILCRATGAPPGPAPPPSSTPASPQSSMQTSAEARTLGAHEEGKLLKEMMRQPFNVRSDRLVYTF